MEISKIAVLIPAHNEEKTIGNLVREVKKIVPSVFVVDDGSTDNTSILAEKNGAIVIRHKHCRGKGAALKTGFNYLLNLPYEYIITMDGDGQHSPSDLPVFVEAIKKKKRAFIIVGKRKIKDSSMPVIRRLTNLSMSLLISLLSFQWIPDSQNGFRAIKKSILREIPLITDHFETETELLLRVAWKKLKIISVPVSTIYSDEKSKIKPTKDTVKFFLMLLKLCFSIWKKN